MGVKKKERRLGYFVFSPDRRDVKNTFVVILSLSPSLFPPYASPLPPLNIGEGEREGGEGREETNSQTRQTFNNISGTPVCYPPILTLVGVKDTKNRWHRVGLAHLSPLNHWFVIIFVNHSVS